MAGRKKGAPSRSAFIREQLKTNSKLSLSDVNDLWKKSHRGDITGTLFYQVKSKLGITRGKNGRAGRRSGNSYLAIEMSLEKLVAETEAIGNKDLAEALRTARRMASAQLV